MLSTFLKLKSLNRQQWLPRQDLEQIQLRKLASLLEHAYRNVPYYRRLFESVGLRPDDIRGIDDLEKIPITTKATLRDLPSEETLAAGYRKDTCIEVKTSGSTGIPLKLYFSPEDKARMRFFILRSHMQGGRRYFDSVATIAGSSYEERIWIQKLGLMRRLFIAADSDPSLQIEALQKFKPAQIIGFPSALERIAERVVEEGIPGIRPRLVTSGAEILEEETRALIARAFETTVIDTYGSYEAGNIAWECREKGRYHVNIDGLVVELVRAGKQARPGETGEVVVTNLSAYAMPIIRYKLGDLCVATDEQCACGRGLPLIQEIIGRSDDMILLEDGREIQPSLLRRVMREIEGIRQFRVIQETRRTIRVQVVGSGNGSDEAGSRRIAQKIREELGKELEVKVERVNEIPMETSGKLCSVVSNVRRNGN